MWSHERQAKILELLVRDGKVLTNDLAGLFDVSRETVRRDLLEMETGGSLNRVYGGAIMPGAEIQPEPAFAQRLAARAQVKDAIAAKACELIPADATLMIDTGTTTLAFARALLARRDVSVITNSIEIAQLAASTERGQVLLLGGRPHRDVPGTYGEMTLAEIDRFRVDFAIISPVGLHHHHGAMDYELHEAEIARAMMRRAKSRVMLCDSSKIGMESRVSICSLAEIDHLVTDAEAPPPLPKGEIHCARGPAS